MSKHHVKILTREQMESLPTKRLLAYKTELYKHYSHSITWAWKEDGSESIVDSLEAAYNLCKEILSTREHVEK